MAQTTVTSNIDQTANVHLNISPEVSFDDCSATVKSSTEPIELLFAELPDTWVSGKRCFLHDAFGHGRTYAVNGLN